MADIRWQRVNDEPFEYAIQQGPHGDEFVKLIDGSCLRRDPDTEIDRLRDALAFYADPDTYCAIGFFPDRPCGEFMDDFSRETSGDYDRPMPGKRAREALGASEQKEP